jgi:hypothetical protein
VCVCVYKHSCSGAATHLAPVPNVRQSNLAR